MEKIPQNVMDIALAPYSAKAAAYLKEAEVTCATMFNMQAHARFSIAQSSYISGTGHFNAAEFIICANQMLTTCFAFQVFRVGGVEGLRTYAANYNRMLITESEQKFRSVIDPHSFAGTLETCLRRTFRKHIFLKAQIAFGDQENPRKAYGSCLLAAPEEIVSLIAPVPTP